MKRILIILCFLLLSSSLYAETQLARMNPYIAGQVTATNSCSISVDTNGTLVAGDSYWQFEPSRYYLGQSHWSPASGTVNICKIGFYLRDITVANTSTFDAFTYRAYVCTMITSSLNTCTEASTTISGATIRSGGEGWYYWDFNTAYSATSGTNYAIVFSMGAPDSSNYVGLGYSSSDTITGTGVGWYEDKYSGLSFTEAGVRIYTQ